MFAGDGKYSPRDDSIRLPHRFEADLSLKVSLPPLFLPEHGAFKAQLMNGLKWQHSSLTWRQTGPSNAPTATGSQE